ncbi:MAG: fluoride efflux transporter CrcB [Candidatus Omnitrophica bacterium]|nr:fluoride efflux transporter CrcB [Candidatus Omnitrophota bacterium]
MAKIIALTLGSVAGGFARYYLAGFVQRISGTGFPYGTLAVNLLGCFLVGFFSAISEEKFLLGPNGRLLLMIGFCGAFTTFSTLMFETGSLMKGGETLRASLNVALSFGAGFLVFRLGILLGELI